jgi:hypothetical protein
LACGQRIETLGTPTRRFVAAKHSVGQRFGTLARAHETLSRTARGDATTADGAVASCDASISFYSGLES